MGHILPEQGSNSARRRWQIGNFRRGRAERHDRNRAPAARSNGRVVAASRHWHSCRARYTVKASAHVLPQGAVVRMSRVFQRLLIGDRAVQARVLPSWQVIVWAFIAPVAVFLTQPAADPPSLFTAPLPMPPDLHGDALPDWP